MRERLSWPCAGTRRSRTIGSGIVPDSGRVPSENRRFPSSESAPPSESVRPSGYELVTTYDFDLAAFSWLEPIPAVPNNAHEYRWRDGNQDDNPCSDQNRLEVVLLN